MITFNDLPGDIKSKIFKMNKDKEREEHWDLLMGDVRDVAGKQSVSLDRIRNTTCIFDRDAIFLIERDPRVVLDGCGYRTHWDWEGNVEIDWCA